MRVHMRDCEADVARSTAVRWTGWNRSEPLPRDSDFRATFAHSVELSVTARRQTQPHHVETHALEEGSTVESGNLMLLTYLRQQVCRTLSKLWDARRNRRPKLALIVAVMRLSLPTQEPPEIREIVIEHRER